MNRNLVLTDGARADSVPNLEIETGEIVGAGHASATGRFDDEQLFYLRARGIPEDQARRLVVRGFFGEIIRKIAVPDVRERLADAIEHELAITESRISSLMTTLEIKDLHVSVTAETEADEIPILKGVDLTVTFGRDARDDGPQRVRQVDAVLRDRRAPEVQGHLRVDHARRRRTCWR